MPEGHTIHRAARLQRRAFKGQVVAADSPQGRFAQGATLLDGARLDDIEAWGKHLLYRWSTGAVLHVHLGLFGRFRTFTRDHPEEPLPTPTPGTRLRLVTAERVLHLAGPTACEVQDPDQVTALLARLGPDPLRRDADPAGARAALRRRRIPIGAALLDQRVLAGIGNVYRAEVLFVIGVHPLRPAALDDATFDQLWGTISQMLRAGERSGRIVTVDPADVGRSRPRDLRRGERLYVYGRENQPCRRCGTVIRSVELAARPISWCPACQPD